MKTAAVPVRYDVQLMAEDMAIKGWNKRRLAARAGVVDRTVGLFLNGDHQTAKTATKLAKALGFSVRRYLISAREAIAS